VLFTAGAQAYPLKTDSAEVLRPGETELVTSLEYERAGATRTTTIEPEFEFGVFDRVHVELEVEHEIERERGQRQRTMEFSLKSRIALLQPAGGFALALQPSLARKSVRSPQRARAQATELGLRALVTRTIRDTQWHFNAGYSRDVHEADDDEIFVGGAVSHRLAAAWKIQAELYTKFAPRGGGGPLWVVNLAAKRKVTKTFSLVTRLGAGLNRRSPDFVGLIGFEWEP